MKVSSDIIKRLNKSYIIEVPVRVSVHPDSRGILGNHSLFIKNAIARGSCLTLHNITFNLLPDKFWNPDTFEEHCKYVFFTFQKSFFKKIITRLSSCQHSELIFFLETLTHINAPYSDVINHPTDPYLYFCGKKLQSLKKSGHLEEAFAIDAENRELLKQAIQALIKKDDLGIQSETLTGNNPFTSLLKALKGAKENTLKQIQLYLDRAELRHDLFKQASKTKGNKNQIGFNAMVAAMITIFKDLGYFEESHSFDTILDAYLEQTGNQIGNLGDFKNNYRNKHLFDKYKRELLELNIPRFIK
ncbi:MAG: hypothetical protein M9959_05425 [Chitinophagaceae bacterium]|nr:hypothetical protein [Chitinophagaceae bacterium]